MHECLEEASAWIVLSVATASLKGPDT
uniref:Uncharacterized protein n=1 Tax=Rhizophora mucronata TaxID=61149 RepID=A0A2P2QIF8_RHIMU